MPISTVPEEKQGTWRVYNVQVSPEKAKVSLQGERWGEPVKIVLNGKSQDPASATLIGKGEDLKDFASITVLLKGIGKIKVNLYYTYNGKYSLLSKDVELSPEWKEVSFKLDEGLESSGCGYALQGGNIIRAGCGGFLWGSVYKEVRYAPFVG